HSWRQLAPEEQFICRQMSVFRGSFTRAAVTELSIEKAELREELRIEKAKLRNTDSERSTLNSQFSILTSLAALVDKSLLRRSVAGRYDMHELVRQYAYQQLVTAGEVEQARRRHMAYFLQLAEQAEPGLQGREQVTWLERLDLEYPNLRAALEW